MSDDRLHGAYDRFADVLYLTVGAPECVRFEEDEDGLIWRYAAASEHPAGVTIREFRTYQKPDQDKLIRKVAFAFREDEPAVRQAIRGLVRRREGSQPAEQSPQTTHP